MRSVSGCDLEGLESTESASLPPLWVSVADSDAHTLLVGNLGSTGSVGLYAVTAWARSVGAESAAWATDAEASSADSEEPPQADRPASSAAANERAINCRAEG